MPVVEGRRPVMNEARDGLQIGAAICALLKLRPRAASLSRFGVFACGWPCIGPIQSFKSSAIISKTFGFFSAAQIDSTNEASRQVIRVFNFISRNDHRFC